MLVTTRKMLDDARDGGYAIGAFNAENAEMVWAIVRAADELRAPVIIQTTSSTLKYFSPEMFAGMIKAEAQKTDVPVALHLDHGSSYELCCACIAAGYTSVMIDGSALPFEENIAVSKKVTDYAKSFGVPVEAELGRVGGKEDDVVGVDDQYTDPKEAVEFVERTGVSSLAIGIGTAHGIYKVAPKLDLDRAADIRKVVSIPLVMHGASGLADEVMQEGVRKGIAKINFATELRVAFSEAVKAYLEKDPKVFDPKKYGTLAREAVKELVKQKMTVCGCNGKA